MGGSRVSVDLAQRQTAVGLTFYGIILGALFPISATLLDIAVSGLSLSLGSAVAVQSGEPLHWIIDSAPLMIGLAGWLFGQRQQRLLSVSSELDGRVRERTAELAAAAERLETIAEVGSAVAGARSLQGLLDEVVNLIVERFDFYHAQVFLVDSSGRVATLKASTGPAGRELLERRHRLAVGSESVIGHVTAQGSPVIAFDTDDDVTHRRNEFLPETRSELAMPLRMGRRVIGALDVQSEVAHAFGEDDIPVFQSMADQLAVAIENVRLLEEARHNLKSIEALNRQLSGEAWVDFLANRDVDRPLGYVADERGVYPVRDGHGEEGVPEGGQSMPLVVRGQTIGSLDVKPGQGEALDEEVQAILEAVSERVALALDNTRLAQQARSAARRQQVINDFSSKVQSVSGIPSILQTTATELGKILGVPRAFVQLETRREARSVRRR